MPDQTANADARPDADAALIVLREDAGGEGRLINDISGGGAAPASEEGGVYRGWRSNPERFGPDALLRVVKDSAGDQGSSSIDAAARKVWALAAVAGGTPDEEVMSAALDDEVRVLSQMAGVQAASIDDVATKLAVVIARLCEHYVHNDGDGPAADFRVIASALADLVVLRHGPVPLPAGALDPIEDESVALAWIERAEKL